MVALVNMAVLLASLAGAGNISTTDADIAGGEADTSLRSRRSPSQAGQASSSRTAGDVNETSVIARRKRDLPTDGRPWRVFGGVEFRQLAVVDGDPLNDLGLRWWAGGSWRLVSGLSLFANLGLQQRVVAEEGESGFLLTDSVTGLNHFHTFSLDSLGLENRSVHVKNRLAAYWPTSRASQNASMRFAIDARSQQLLDVFSGLMLGADAVVQYRNHIYAERAGTYGGMNTQYVTRLGLLAEAGVPLAGFIPGDLSLGLALRNTWRWRYGSRDEHESSSSSARSVLQEYGWELYAEYTPIRFVSFSVSLEQGGNVLRNGVVNTFFMNRDETELVFALTTRY